MVLYIPVQPVPNQQLAVTLGGQSCTIRVYQQAYGLYVDLYIGTVPIVLGIIAQNYNRIVRNTYLGFIGDLFFYDTQGEDDPVYTGLSTRWFFAYLEDTDIAQMDLT